ncbi:hypothetical protein [Halobacteriovorax sp. HLS]|uniref:hypothetical protein n=1 Tax=Halobacteriovorax sp. HLS TaxID=2234000 RepID=UPI000FD794FE|nr:hypothetical protein [Halobacteriovorax sp. HLS]
MTNFLGELRNKTILSQDIVYKLQQPLRNAMTDSSEVLWTATDFGSLCTNVPSDYTLANATGNDVFSKSSLPGPSSSSLSGTTASAVISLVRTYMNYYAKVQKIKIRNTGVGNAQSPMTLIAYLQTDRGSTTSNVLNAVDTAASANNIATGQVITAENLNNFINSCSNIWRDYCINNVKHTYSVNYCHSNHCSHSNHGSRGRR